MLFSKTSNKFWKKKIHSIAKCDRNFTVLTSKMSKCDRNCTILTLVQPQIELLRINNKRVEICLFIW